MHVSNCGNHPLPFQVEQPRDFAVSFANSRRRGSLCNTKLQNQKSNFTSSEPGNELMILRNVGKFLAYANSLLLTLLRLK